MGSRDYRKREHRKPKRDAKKLPPITITPAPMNVEVVRKGKKREEAEEAEE